MVLKTFNVKENVYAQFSKFCKSHGISMSRQIQMFMESFIETNHEANEEYLKKLKRIRKGNFIKVKSFSDRYEL